MDDKSPNIALFDAQNKIHFKIQSYFSKPLQPEIYVIRSLEILLTNSVYKLV